MLSEFPYVYMHRHGYMFHDKGCGNAAFFLTRKPERMERVCSKDVRNLDGSDVAPDAQIVCASCGDIMALYHDDIVEAEPGMSYRQ